MALGIALSPLPIAAILAMLMSPKACTNAFALLLGWFAGLWMVGVIVFLMPFSQTERGDPAAAAGYIRLVLGALLLYFAVRQWQRHSPPNNAFETSKFLAGLDAFGVGKSALTGFFLVTLHPKNLPLCAAGATAIDLYALNLTAQFGAYVVFTLVSSLTLATPIIVYLAMGDRANRILDRWKVFLIQNNRTVLVVLLVIIGSLLLTRGIMMLAG